MLNGFSEFLAKIQSDNVLSDPGPERGDLPDDYVPITISEQFIRHPSIGLGNSGCYTCKASNEFASVTKGICIEGTV